MVKAIHYHQRSSLSFSPLEDLCWFSVLGLPVGAQHGRHFHQVQSSSPFYSIRLVSNSCLHIALFHWTRSNALARPRFRWMSVVHQTTRSFNVRWKVRQNAQWKVPFPIQWHSALLSQPLVYIQSGSPLSDFLYFIIEKKTNKSFRKLFRKETGKNELLHFLLPLPLYSSVLPLSSGQTNNQIGYFTSWLIAA